jgi:ADP-heptose:LPS heptosyltransferase
MHILKNQTPIGTLAPGEWLVQDDNAFQLAAMAERGSVSLRKMEFPPAEEMLPQVQAYHDKFNPGRVAPSQILLIRSGAIGDLLLLTPATRALRAKYPNAQITLCCNKRHWDIFAQGDTHFAEYPIPVSELSEFDLIIPLENVVELSTERGQHATDAFAEALGVTVTDYRPVYKVTEEENIYPKSSFNNRKRVALQLRASAMVRDYPVEQWGTVMQYLAQRGWDIFMLGKNDAVYNHPPPHVHDCSKLTFRQAAAVLATCDVFCGVDSSFFNLCPALGVPAIGLFGPVDWRTRIKEGSGQIALSGVGDCAPCGWTNSRAGVKFPAGMPCSKTGFCVPLAEIKPERIVSQIEKYAKK